MDTRISDWSKLGSTVRDARAARQLSQHELAELARVSRSWLARVESGHRGAALEPLLRLLGALDLAMVVRDDRRPSAPTSIEAARPGEDMSSALGVALQIERHRTATAARRRAWQDASVRRDEDGGHG